MKRIDKHLSCIVTVALGLGAAAFAQPPSGSAPLEIPKNLKTYFVAFLVKGESSIQEDSPEGMELLRKHLSYIRSRIEKKVYAVAGPFRDNGNIAGMVIVNANSLEEATAVLKADPAVQAGRFKFEIHPAMFADIDAGAKY